MKSKIYCGWEMVGFMLIGCCMGFIGGLTTSLS